MQREANHRIQDKSEETFAVAVWISSVLYSSCVCFGNIGRQLV